MDVEKLALDARQLFGVSLTSRQASQMAAYARELQDWNSRINLTAIRDEDGIRNKHFLDSISCVSVFRDSPPKRLVDVGTGAGFPGLVLKILHPAMRLTLVESVGKKAGFCTHVAELLELKDVEVLSLRAEEVGQLPAHREQYDWAVARAVANLPVLSEYLLPLVKVGGWMLAQKGESGPAEAQAAERAIRLLGGQIRQLAQVTLPGVVEERTLVLVEKTAATPPGYPRRPGIPARKPL